MKPFQVENAIKVCDKKGVLTDFILVKSL